MRAQYVLSNPKGGNNDTQALGVGYQYDFSKRTALYTSLTQFRNDDNVAGSTRTRWHGSVPSGLTTADDNDITEFVVGVRPRSKHARRPGGGGARRRVTPHVPARHAATVPPGFPG